ncbi:MAG: segregation/condensation protein A [Chloroflexi bacterium]|nr:segregation/condensation protein A [Chloroflexota bacterium]
MSANSDPYCVALDVFEGPLDLLLRLIEHQELDITRVSLALVADQYLKHIARIADITSENLADFLVIAAKLLVIKSKSLLPPPVIPDSEDEEDDGEQLARQLVEYKRCKDAAARLRELEQRGWHTYLRLAPMPKLKGGVIYGSITPAQLTEALLQAILEQPSLDSVDTVVQPVHIHIGDCIRRITQLLAQQNSIPLSCALANAHSRLEVIVLFLAVLELIKQQKIQVQQEALFGEIFLEARPVTSDNENMPRDVDNYEEWESA